MKFIMGAKVYRQRSESQCIGNPIVPAYSLFHRHFQHQFRRPNHRQPVSELPKIHGDLPVIEIKTAL